MNLPAPYYSADGITILCADCRPVLAAMDPREVALLLADPPYGMDYKPLRGADGSKRWTDGVAGDADPFEPAHLLAFHRIVTWGANWYADRLPTSGGWLVWDKTPRGRKEGFFASDAELAWTNCCNSVRKFSMQWGGEARGGERHYHPTQKPVALARWIIEMFTAPGDLVLDPYMGAGWVALACRDTGRRFIGIEIDPVHCSTAASRLSQRLLDFGAPKAGAC